MRSPNTLFTLFLLVSQASAIVLLLYSDNGCLLDQEDPAEDALCIGLDYNSCCGDPDELYGSAVGNLEEESWPDRPVLRAFNREAGENPPPNPCALVRAQVELTNDASNPGQFPCLEGPADDAFHGFQVDIVPPAVRAGREGAKVTGHLVPPNGWGIYEGGSIYGIHRNSETGILFELSRGNMTVMERREFIKSHNILQIEPASQNAKISI